jgi:hypothetical protein
MTYPLRRLRLHGLNESVRKTHHYQVTDFGFRVALFFTRSYSRLFRDGLAQLVPHPLPGINRLAKRYDLLNQAIDEYIGSLKLVAA